MAMTYDTLKVVHRMSLDIGECLGEYKVVGKCTEQYSLNLYDLECVFCGSKIRLTESRVNSLQKQKSQLQCINHAEHVKAENKDESIEYEFTGLDRNRLSALRSRLLSGIQKDDISTQVDDDWVASSENFIIWSMMNGYRPWRSLYKIDNTKGYTKDNCEWLMYRTGWQKSLMECSKDTPKEMYDKQLAEYIKLMLRKMRLQDGSISKKLVKSIHKELSNAKQNLFRFKGLIITAKELDGPVKYDTQEILLDISKCEELLESIERRLSEQDGE